MSDFHERLGPFYTVEGVAKWRHCDEEEVRRDIDQRVLLGIVLGDGVIALPARQFNDSGDPLPGLASLFEVVGHCDPVGVALILFTRSEPFDGQTAAEWLREGRVGEVLDIVRRAFGPLQY